MQLFVWTAVYFVCVLGVSLLGKGVRVRKIIKIIFLPSLIFYAVCRAIGCIVSLSPIERIEFFQDNKPFLKPGKSRILYFGNFLSVYATHISIVVCFFLLKGLIPVNNWESFCLHPLGEIWKEPEIAGVFFTKVFAAIDFTNYLFWITCYLFIGLAANFDLSIPEFIATICFNTLACWICGLLTWLGVGVSFFSRGWFIKHFYIAEWWGVGSFYLFSASASSILLLCLYGASPKVKSIVKSRLEKRKQKKRRIKKNKTKQQISRT